MYTALYRKKRPKAFADVVGQWPIITTLSNQLKSRQITHAYLFCGTRGTGKTSCAKIFARAVNCVHSTETGEPCNTCETCADILSERSLSVIEIDAASNNGVDSIRDLREEVKYPPTSGKFKVYIIDEAHMLTTQAFNALLKTLEEPPGHIIFIFATTDPQKIPATILSRCQRYDFKRITRSDMVSTLADYMESENIAAHADALEYIAGVSDGAMRDALSILDQCLSLYSGSDITLENVQNLLGAVDLSALFSYSEALIKKDMTAALSVINSAAKDGRDLSRFTSDIITHFRNLLIGAKLPDILDYAPETVERYRSAGAAMNPAYVIRYIEEYSELQNQMRYLPQERLALEVCTIKLCGEGASASIVPTTSATLTIPASVASATSVPTTVAPTTPAPTTSTPPTSPSLTSLSPTSSSPNSPSPNSPPPSASPPPTPPTQAPDWKDFCATQSGLLKSMLTLCQAKWEENNITITCRDQASKQYIKDQSTELKSNLKKYFNLPKEPSIVFLTDDGYNDTESFKQSIQQQITIPVEFQ